MEYFALTTALTLLLIPFVLYLLIASIKTYDDED